jgi:hypothetical protein
MPQSRRRIPENAVGLLQLVESLVIAARNIRMSQSRKLQVSFLERHLID